MGGSEQKGKALVENLATLVNTQPSEQDTPLQLLQKASERGVGENIELLLNLTKGQENLPFKHCLGTIEWNCEWGMDVKNRKGQTVLKQILKDITDPDNDFGEKDSFSLLCHRYLLSKNSVESERKTTWLGETGGVGCLILGGVLLALVPGVAKTAGICPIISSGVCAGLAQAHQGNAARIQTLGVNLEEAIKLIAGSEFFEKLDQVKTDRGFKKLFADNEMKFKEGLSIYSDGVMNTIRGREAAGSRPNPDSETTRLSEQSQQRGQNNNGGCTIS